MSASSSPNIGPNLNEFKLDPKVLKFNQISIITGILLAAILGQWWIVAFVAAVMLAGTFNPNLAAFKRIYSSFVRPALKLSINLQDDDPRAHNFAQGVGGVFLLAATIAFVLGSSVVGWVLSAIVVALATLNLTTNICVGCFMYFQLRMLQARWRNAQA